MGCRLPDSDPTAPDGSTSAGGLELTVVVPTFNERANVRRLISLVEAALGDIRWQVIFVDDNSPDGTAAEVKAMVCAAELDGLRRDPTAVEEVCWRCRMRRDWTTAHGAAGAVPPPRLAVR